jgi:LEA14-like dessication related protein
MDLRLEVDAYNPNRIALSAQKVVGKVTLDGKDELGAASITEPITLPAGEHTSIPVVLTVKWSGAEVLGRLLATGRAIPYTVDSTVTVGGSRLNVDVPVHMQGVITQEQLLQAAAKALPAIPLLK